MLPDPATQRRGYNSASHAKRSNRSCDIVPSNAHPVRGRPAKCRTGESGTLAFPEPCYTTVSAAVWDEASELAQSWAWASVWALV